MHFISWRDDLPNLKIYGQNLQMVCHSNETSVAGRNLNFLVNFSLATVKSEVG